MQIWKTLKLFVSSTFKDLELERDQLAQIFQKVKDQIFDRQLGLIPYDLRWRDRHEQEDLVQWCLGMLEQCQYFVGILGYRYGWRPSKDEQGNPNSGRISITEMEFRKAIARLPKAHRFFCVADMAQYTKAELAKETAEDLASVTGLRKYLSDSGEPVYEYHSIEELLVIIQTELQRRIDQDYDPGRKVPLESFTRKETLAAILQEKVRGFVGRESYLQKLHTFANAATTKNYLALWAVAGTGKSALSARFIADWRTQHPEVSLLAHYMSMGGDSREVTGVMTHLGEQLRECGILKAPLENDPAVMRVQVRNALEQTDRKLVLVLDGLDEISDSGKNVMWLSPNLPANIRVLVTTRPSESLDRLKAYPRTELLELPPLDDQEISAIIRGYNQTHRMNLNDKDVELLKKRAAGNPLFLKVALDEILSSGIAVGQLATTIDALFNQIVARLKRSHGETIVSDYLGLIAASRMGVLEGELHELLTVRTTEKLSEEFLLKIEQTFDKVTAPLRNLEQEFGEAVVADCLGLMAASRGGIPQDELRDLMAAPRTTRVSDDFLLKVHKALDNFIIVRGGLLTFFHPEFERAIKMSLGKAKMRGYHRRLADYLKAKGYGYIRTLSELPYQEQWGERYEELLKLLADIQFLEQKCQAGLVNGLEEDFQRSLKEPAVAVPHGLSVELAPDVKVNREMMRMLDKGLNLVIQFIRRHPQSLFQSLWNFCYWYDAPEATAHYQAHGESQVVPPWQRSGDKLYQLVEHWRKIKESVPGFVWLKSRRPVVPIGSPLIKSLQGHEDEITSVAISRDGQYVASAAKDRTIQVWHALSGESLRVLRGHEKPISGIAFSPDGSKVISGSWDLTLRLWDTASGECVRTFKGHEEAVTAVVFTPDGQQLVSGAEDMTVRIWDVASGQCLKTLTGHKDAVTCVAISPNGQSIASGSEDRAVQIWDMASGQCRHVLISHLNWVKSVAFSPNSMQVVSSSEDNTVKIWDVTGGKLIYTLTKKGLEREEELAEATPDEKTDGKPFVILRSQLSPKNDQEVFNCAMFSPDNAKLALGSSDKTIRIWDISSGKYVQILTGHDKSVVAMAWSSDGNYIVSGSSDKAVRIWDAASKEALHTIVGHKDRITTLAYSNDGKYVASGSYDETVRLWDAHTGECLAMLAGHKDLITAVRFAPDSKTLVSASFDNTLRIWHLETGKLSHILQGHAHAVHDVAFSPDGKLIASASSDRTVRVWNADSGVCLQHLIGHRRGVLCVMFSPDGKLIASSGKGNAVRLWDAAKGDCLKTMDGHQREVLSIAFSPDGRYLASASEDNSVRLWDVASGQCLRQLQEHTHGVFSVAFTPDGQRLISCAADGSIRTWDMASNTWLPVKSGFANAKNLALTLPWQVVVSDIEATIERTRDGQAIARFPDAIKEAAITPHHLLIGGNRLGYVYLLEIVGKV